jgi:cyclophilin family peptidyl-prolyl cis-trans isomerase
VVRDQPSYAPTILITIFFGAWGLWPAFRHSRMASQRGYKTDGYWWSFGLSLLVPLGVTAIILVTSLAFTHSLSTITTVPSTPLGGSAGSATQSTTTSTTAPAPAGGSGNTSPGATTTSANCPHTFSATLNKPSYASSPPMTIDTSNSYTATVTTDVGPFTIQLDPKAAPMAVNSFVFLANQHFYDCVIFHRVIKTFMDQTGDPTGTGDGGPGYQFADELPATANPQYPLGSVAMANSGPNTNGSQFFIVAGPEGESLAPSYTIFGQVTSGMNVVDEINADGASASSSLGTPTTLHRIVSVSIEAG